ncbi:fimbrial protein [Entomohabitans teleogrylli]|uniref:fimbrial protein n=1 Tax=Entomohabitans teleogrylli TaxID=1384589 RepID=UPI0012B68433|nr:fimbrial protein [Entomohabitans teleogrylli]
MTVLWYTNTGSVTGEIAGTCTLDYNTISAFSIPQTIVVDNSIPDGSVIYSWDYGNFLDFNINCIGNGVSNSGGRALNTGITHQRFNLSFPDAIPVRVNNIAANLTLKMYAKYEWNNQQACMDPNLGCRNGATGYFAEAANVLLNNGAEYSGTHNGTVSVSQRPSLILLPIYDAVTGKYRMESGRLLVSTRAELIKTGNLTTYGPVTALAPGVNGISFNGVNSSVFPSVRDMPIPGNAITLVAPSCQLRTDTYDVAMGRWAADMYNYNGGNPVTGTEIPVSLQLECSGQVPDVTVRFTDAGSEPSVSMQKNITLYDDGGNKINGLEIAMQYNGQRINIDGTTRVSTGSHGEVQNNQSSEVFNSQSTINFTAHYYQTGAITRAGVPFTGNVRGSVIAIVENN